MTQASLDFAEPVRARKRGHVPRTSVAAYRERPRDARALDVMDALELMAYLQQPPPTSAELWQKVMLHRRTPDLLTVRRGLSDALKLGLVAHAGERKCSVSHRTCVTWKVASR
jgi:hypothetical protein